MVENHFILIFHPINRLEICWNKFVAPSYELEVVKVLFLCYTELLGHLVSFLLLVPLIWPDFHTSAELLNWLHLLVSTFLNVTVCVCGICSTAAAIISHALLGDCMYLLLVGGLTKVYILYLYMASLHSFSSFFSEFSYSHASQVSCMRFYFWLQSTW